ncbi:MAG: Hsp70 family protein, partial [Geminicoccaceae bacterium]|nr:Hsp70 family protein [Geminicoccaceae bacterium]
DIDANGIVNVSARDKATGKEQQIRIQASGGLSEAEIEQMVKEAETHAEEDRRRREQIEARNQADSLIYSTERSLGEHGDKLAASDRSAIEQAISELRGSLDTADATELRTKTEHLAQLAMKLGEAMYRAQSDSGGGSDDGAAPGGGSDGGAGRGEEGVVDADFEEVEDDKKKSA